MQRSSVFLGALLVMLGCAVDTPPEILEENQEIFGGIADNGHGYVVGVGDSFGPFCSGTLISTRTVITAGHCFGGITRVFFGRLANQSVTVAQEIRHPGFNGFTLANDLAILRLQQDAPFPPAPLLRETMTNSPDFIGPNFTFVGYGDSNNGGSGTRRVVTFPIDAVGPANLASFNGFVDSIDATMFYYKEPGENTCFGDSGGPAFAVRNRVERHAGVTSFGDPGCTIDGVQNRTDIPAINGFIQARIDQFESGNPCKNDGVCNDTCIEDGFVTDPDCADLHCGDDGICSPACVLPLDNDCRSLGVNHCVNDGVCDPTCAVFDAEDCGPLCGAEGTCVPGCGNDPDCAGGSECGNGIVEPGEGCDDGNNSNNDTCKNNCTLNFCGDGFVNNGVEECDDGNFQNGDGCDTSCSIEGSVCGDGVVEGNEQCDDGNNVNTDACRNDCTLPFCGDSIVDADEECDDGNPFLDDGCLNCVLAACGDGFVNEGEEECDDGNTADGDGCSAACTVEQPAGGCAVGSGNGDSGKAIFLLFFCLALGLVLRRR